MTRINHGRFCYLEYQNLSLENRSSKLLNTERVRLRLEQVEKKGEEIGIRNLTGPRLRLGESLECLAKKIASYISANRGYIGITATIVITPFS